MNDHHQFVDWKSITQDLVYAHQSFEREGKILVSKLLMEKSEIKTRFYDNLKQNQEFKYKIDSLESIVESLVEKNRIFEKQQGSDSEVIRNLENEKLELREYKEKQLADALKDNEHMSDILTKMYNIVAMHHDKKNNLQVLNTVVSAKLPILILRKK